MLYFGEHCSMTERRADEAVRDVVDWLKCDFMQDHVGEVFGGVISSVTNFGFFVRLDDLFIDGLVHVSTLENDYYNFDVGKSRLIGENSGFSYRLGDKVKIKVEAVNPEERKIDFSLVGSGNKPRRLGKTAKDRANIKQTKPTANKGELKKESRKTSSVKKIKEKKVVSKKVTSKSSTNKKKSVK